MTSTKYPICERLKGLSCGRRSDIIFSSRCSNSKAFAACLERIIPTLRLRPNRYYSRILISLVNALQLLLHDRTPEIRANLATLQVSALGMCNSRPGEVFLIKAPALFTKVLLQGRIYGDRPCEFREVTGFLHISEQECSPIVLI